MSQHEIYLDEDDLARLNAGYTVVRLAGDGGPEVEIFPPDTPTEAELEEEARRRKDAREADERAEVQAEAEQLFPRLDEHPLDAALPNDLLTASINLGRKARQLGMDEVREQFRARGLPS